MLVGIIDDSNIIRWWSKSPVITINVKFTFIIIIPDNTVCFTATTIAILSTYYHLFFIFLLLVIVTDFHVIRFITVHVITITIISISLILLLLLLILLFILFIHSSPLIFIANITPSNTIFIRTTIIISILHHNAIIYTSIIFCIAITITIIIIVTIAQ